MRVIRTDKLLLPTGWEADAAAALAKVVKLATASSTDRNAEIERHAAKTWRALKELLAALSHDKCWYCESRQDRSLGAVDHFRPKGRLEELVMRFDCQALVRISLIALAATTLAACGSTLSRTVITASMEVKRL